jgi:hypothetical protein
MWNAIDHNGDPGRRGSVIEPEQGDHAVHVDEQYRNIFRGHRDIGR